MVISIKKKKDDQTVIFTRVQVLFKPITKKNIYIYNKLGGLNEKSVYPIFIVVIKTITFIEIPKLFHENALCVSFKIKLF